MHDPLEIRILAQMGYCLFSAFTEDRAGKTYNTNSSMENKQTKGMKTTPMQNMDQMKSQFLENNGSV